MSVEVTIGAFVPPVKENPFAPAVDALIEAGEDQAITLTVDAPSVNKTARAFGDAANDKGYTAKRRLTYFPDADTDSEGSPVPVSSDDVKAAGAEQQVSLVFTLGPKQNRPGSGRKPENAEAASTKGAKK